MWRDSVIGLLLASAAFMIACAEEKKRLNVTVPRWVLNNTDDNVVLDCAYEYEPGEEQLVIKWFLNDDTEAVYQWIPDSNSRLFSEKFKDNVDWETRLESGDKYNRYRQLVLVKPTIEFRGTYQCSVNSKTGYGVAEAEMNIYAPAKNITLVYKSLPDNKVNVTCVVQGIFPKPDIQLFSVSSDSDVPKSLELIDTASRNNGIHGFDLSVTSIVSTYQLNHSADTTFQCVVLIPESEYQQMREKAYHPMNEMAILEPLYEVNNQSPSSLTCASFLYLIVVVIFLL